MEYWGSEGDVQYGGEFLHLELMTRHSRHLGDSGWRPPGGVGHVGGHVGGQHQQLWPASKSRICVTARLTIVAGGQLAVGLASRLSSVIIIVDKFYYTYKWPKMQWQASL